MTHQPPDPQSSLVFECGGTRKGKRSRATDETFQSLLPESQHATTLMWLAALSSIMTAVLRSLMKPLSCGFKLQPPHDLAGCNGASHFLTKHVTKTSWWRAPKIALYVVQPRLADVMGSIRTHLELNTALMRPIREISYKINDMARRHMIKSHLNATDPMITTTFPRKWAKHLGTKKTNTSDGVQMRRSVV
ncbi:unnamed protein product [Peronospora belbahrii]|uniref:Uncharacterized protein n=1 Tax=Peronospora belbahrii TaxID=622444 RepID=A0AAU9KHM6_9STRA|nr:unnamed protein product [Peronospora belbahrii]